jgi:hypothetical protein
MSVSSRALARSAAGATLLGLLLALAACGPLPRPFQPESKGVDLRRLAERRVLHVLPATGESPHEHGDFAVALAAALESQGLEATTAGTPGNRLVSVHTRLRPTAEGESLSLVAQVEEPDGTLVAQASEEAALPAGAWDEADPFVLAGVADRLAEILAGQLRPAPIEQVAIPGFPGARLVVLPISGAPGDGGDALPSALRAELERRDLPLARHPGPDDLLIAGLVELEPAGAGTQQATITWRLLEAGPEGGLGPEIGRIAQANRIPEGSLDGRWGQIAVQVADYAADGLEDLLDQASRAQ